ncbi:MAG: nucleoside hydrolase [Thermaceae bacterium]|nr:nucleoside hydrolase [Thermaceae bacterium]
MWIDTDPGFDDLAAITLAAARPELNLLGLGLVVGNAPLSRTLDNALRLAQVLQLERPVYGGCDRPILGHAESAENLLGLGAPGSLDRRLPPATWGSEPGHAALELIRAAQTYPGELTLVAIAPLTNVALAMRLEPQLPELLQEIVLMGGSTNQGNHTAAAEFNIYADPEAAAVVFGSGARISMFGLNLTTIGALSCTGMQAAMVFTGATDKTAFLTFLHQVLLPTLRPGQIVVMDNLGAHRTRGVQPAIEAAGCTVIFTLPYSPEFNPIEGCWSKVKAILRGIAARTRESLTQAIASALDLIMLQDIQGWFNHAGYCLG